MPYAGQAGQNRRASAAVLMKEDEFVKKNAYVFVDDFGHPKDKFIPIVPLIFDYDEWHVCVMDGVDSICLMANAPDLIVSFKMGNSGIVYDRPSWYETSAFTYQWMRWVREEGMGLLLIHSGLPGIPPDHPVMLEGARGYFAGHKQLGPMHVEPEPVDHPIVRGVQAFDTPVDEHFEIGGFHEDNTVLAFSTSDRSPRQPAAWCHEPGNGRVAVLCPGHATAGNETLRHPEMIKMMRNAVRWCGGEEE